MQHSKTLILWSVEQKKNMLYVNIDPTYWLNTMSLCQWLAFLKHDIFIFLIRLPEAEK